MAGVPAGLPAGVRLSDHISLGVIARTVPAERVRDVLVETGTVSERERDLPAQVMVYYVIALALYMGSSTREVLRCLLEGLRWLWGAEAVKVAGKSGISQARSRLGEAPLRRLYAVLVHPIATRASKGAWYRDWRLVSLDGSCLEVADTAANRVAFGMPGASRGASAFPQLRFVALVENGTHVLFGAQLGRYDAGETTLAHAALTALQPGMLCLADRQFFGHALWQAAVASGADLLWRVKHNLRLPRETMLADGSYLTTLYPSDKDRRQRSGGIRVRVIEYRLEGVAGAEPLYRLVSSILDPAQAPAAELAALYHERWEIEGALAELKTPLRGARVVLRSKTQPWCVRSSGACCWRISLCVGSCTKLPCRPTRTPTGSPSPTPCVSSAASCRWSQHFPPRARRTLHRAVLEEILEERVVSGRGRQVPRGVKRKMSSYPLRPRASQPTTRVNFSAAIRITK